MSCGAADATCPPNKPASFKAPSIPINVSTPFVSFTWVAWVALVALAEAEDLVEVDLELAVDGHLLVRDLERARHLAVVRRVELLELVDQVHHLDRHERLALRLAARRASPRGACQCAWSRFYSPQK